VESALIVILGFIPLGILGIAVLVKFVQGSDYDLFEPLTLVAFNVFLGVTGRAAWIALTDPIKHTDLLLSYPQSVLFDGALMMAIAMTALVAGYLVAHDSRFPRIPLVAFGEWSSKRTLFLAGLLALLALAGMALFLSAVGASITSVWTVSAKRAEFVDGTRIALGYHRWLASLGRPAFLLALIMLLAEKRRLVSWNGLILVAAGIAASMWPVISGVRSQLVWLALGAIIILYYTGSLRSVTRRLKPGRIVLPFVVVLVAVVAMTGLREGARSVEQLAEVASPVQIAEKIFASGNFVGIEKASVLAQKVPQDVPYLNGESLVSWMTAPIPRSMWLDKPQTSLGYRFGSEVYGRAYETTRGGGHPPSLPVELYWNFGFLGVAVGMLLYGLALATYYRAFRPYLLERDLGAIFVYVLTLDALATTMIGVNLSAGVADLLMNAAMSVAIVVFVSAGRIRVSSYLRPVVTGRTR